MKQNQKQTNTRTTNKHQSKTTPFLLAPAAILTRRGRFQFLVSLVAAFLSLPTELPKQWSPWLCDQNASPVLEIYWGSIFWKAGKSTIQDKAEVCMKSWPTSKNKLLLSALAGWPTWVQKRLWSGDFHAICDLHLFLSQLYYSLVSDGELQVLGQDEKLKKQF